jgi:epoxyqueuosine reductase
VDLRETIRRHAHALGFDLVGVASADPLPDGDRFRAWLEAGYAGGMSWLHRDPDRRVTPSRIVPGARSVLVLAMEYGGEVQAPARGGPVGEISRYARGEDYHRVIERRLKRLLAELPELAGRPVAGRWYVDTGPVLERAAARAGGLGFIGKNTCLIAPRRGSWLFLSEIVLDLPLEPDPPAIGRCGKCARCLEACPTGAFAAPHVLDSRRCISYLTVEHRGPIPRELRAAIGTRIFGCDVCQEVCPFNRFASAETDAALAVRPENVAPELIPLLDLDADGFRRRFPRSAVRRAKRSGFVRNVAVALGNAGDRRAVPALVRALVGDPEPLVRSHAAWALGRLGGEPVRRALAAAARAEPDRGVLDEIAAAG